MYSWAESLLDQDAPDLCEPEGPGGPGVTLKQRDAVSGQVLQEQKLRWPRLRVQVTIFTSEQWAVPYSTLQEWRGPVSPGHARELVTNSARNVPGDVESIVTLYTLNVLRNSTYR